eukprot:s542_g12.t1
MIFWLKIIPTLPFASLGPGPVFAMAPIASLPPVTSLAPSLPSLALDLPLDDAIDILKRRQAHHQSAPVLPPATPLKHAVLAQKDSSSHFSSTMSSTSWGRVTSRESSISHRMPSRQRAIKVVKSKNLLASTSAPRLLPVAQPIREDVVEQAQMPEELPKAHAKLPKLSSTKRSNRDSIGPLPPNWRPSSKGQMVSRAAAAAFWGITLEDDGSDLGDEEDFQGSTGFHRRSSHKPQTEFPLAALHAATSVPLSDLKEACGIFGRFARSESEDITEARLDMQDFGSLLSLVTGAQDASELAPEFLKSAFHTADRNHTGDIDIWEFVTWYSAFSFSEAVCVNKFARETRDVARKHGMNILNIERYKKAFDRDPAAAVFTLLIPSAEPPKENKNDYCSWLKMMLYDVP